MNESLKPRSAKAQQPSGDGDAPRLLTQVQICHRLGITTETWRNWRKAGKVPPAADVPGHPRWHVEVIDEFERRLRGFDATVRYFRTARRMVG